MRHLCAFTESTQLFTTRSRHVAMREGTCLRRVKARCVCRGKLPFTRLTWRHPYAGRRSCAGEVGSLLFTLHSGEETIFKLAEKQLNLFDVIAAKHAGATAHKNLARARFSGNRFKGSDIASVDPTMRMAVFLFNTREQRCNRHIRLHGGKIEGITASGRATTSLLHLSDAERVAYRLGLISIGHYPTR
jgi:hypothetical protein